MKIAAIVSTIKTFNRSLLTQCFAFSLTQNTRTNLLGKKKQAESSFVGAKIIPERLYCAPKKGCLKKERREIVHLCEGLGITCSNLLRISFSNCSVFWLEKEC